MTIDVKKVNIALMQAALWPTDEPPPNALPLYRRMKKWIDPDNPERDVGLIVIDGRVQQSQWNFLRKVFEDRGEFLPELDGEPSGME